MPFPAAVGSLNHQDFRRFFAGQLVSLIGTWMQSVGQSWLILDLTTSPFKLGLIAALQFLPVLVLVIPAGAWVDRLPKRRLIMLTQTAFMLQAFILSALVFTHRVQYWHVALLAAAYGCVNAFDIPARQSFVVEMAGKVHLSNAIALNAAVFNGARVVGPAVAGLLIARYGVAMAFLINGLSFLAVILALFGVQARGLPGPRTGAHLYQEIGEGLTYAWRSPLISLVLGLLLAISLFVINFNVLVPLLAKDVLQQGAEGFGLLMSAYGVGAMVGAVVLAASARERPSLPVLVGAGLLLCLFTMLIRAAGGMGFAALLLLGAGFFQTSFTANCNAALQSVAPDEMRGRVMSLYVLVFTGISPFGALFSGAIAEAFGPLNGFLVGGGLGLLTSLAFLAWQRGRTGGVQLEPRAGD